MLTGLANSAFIAVVTLVLQMLFSSMAGYALARIPARGRNAVFFLILSTLMIPSAVTFVPTFAVVAYLGGVNTRWGIIAPGLFSAFSIFLFRQFYLRFPTEIEEAGRLDGLGYFGVYWHLLLPNSTSILMALGVLTFIGSWNAFLWPLVIGQDPSSWTVQVVLSTFLTAQTHGPRPTLRRRRRGRRCPWSSSSCSCSATSSRAPSSPAARSNAEFLRQNMFNKHHSLTPLALAAVLLAAPAVSARPPTVDPTYGLASPRASPP